MLYSFFKSIILGFSVPLGMLVAKWVPTPCCDDAYSVGTPKWALWEKGWQKHHETTFSPRFGRFFMVSKRSFFLGGFVLDATYWEGQASWAWPTGFHPWSAALVSYPLNLLMLVAGLLLVTWRWIHALSFLLLLSTG